MLPALLLLLGVPNGAAPTPSAPTFERQPIAWHLSIPSSASSTMSQALTGTLQQKIQHLTSLRPVQMRSIGITPERCGTNLECWVESLCPEQAKRIKDAALSPFGNSRIAETSPLEVPYALLVTVHGNFERTALLLLDLNSALAAYKTVYAQRERTPTALEDAIYAQGTKSLLTRDRRLDKAIDQLFVTINPAFKKSGHWRPNGSLRILQTPSGLSVMLNGKRATQTAEGQTQIDNIPEGQYTLTIEDQRGRYLPNKAQVRINRGEIFSHSPTMVRAPSAIPLARRATFWTGIASAAAGASLIAYALLAPQRTDTVQVCPGDCPNSQRLFATFNDFRTGDAEPGRGVPVAPLGYSLVGLGAAFSLGTWLIGDEETWPWLPWLIGAVVGSASMSVSVLVN